MPTTVPPPAKGSRKSRRPFPEAALPWPRCRGARPRRPQPGTGTGPSDQCTAPFGSQCSAAQGERWLLSQQSRGSTPFRLQVS